MRSLKQRLFHRGSNGVGTVAVVAAVVGVIAGAAVVIAGAMALSNEKNRAKLKGVLNDAKGKITGLGKDIDTKVEKKIVKGGKRIVKKAKKILDSKNS